METARYLLLLNPKSPSWSDVSGGHNKLRWEDIAVALSMGDLNQLSYVLARTKYCQDSSCAEALVKQVGGLVKALAQKGQWRARGTLLNKLAQLACYESLQASHCPTCRGRGQRRNGMECDDCHGSGRKPMSARSRYRFAGIDKRNWERRWQQRYEDVFRRLCDAENQALSHLSWQLHSYS